MQKIPLPSKIEITPGTKPHESIISIQPCHPGYGTTLGNSLRRLMLSSLPGAAVTAFKIKGVQHEFAAIPNVKEDVVEISLNLKQLRLKVHSAEPVRIELHAKGEKKVTAADIKATSDVEVVNPELLIATLTAKDAELDIEIIVSQGRGFIPVEAQEKESLEIGMIALDSIFTPVRNVGFRIENVRVGQMTNYENLILNVETDGSITPQEAMNQSSQILIDHFNFILDETGESKSAAMPDMVEDTSPSEVMTSEPVTEGESEPKPKKRGRPKKEVTEEPKAESET